MFIVFSPIFVMETKIIFQYDFVAPSYQLNQFFFSIFDVSAPAAFLKSGFVA